MTKLTYGNTNTFFIPGSKGGLLVDTDYAGTLQAMYKALKRSGIQVKDIAYVLATHYHPDHMGLISQLMEQGVKLLLMDVQKRFVHGSDPIFERDGLAGNGALLRREQRLPCPHGDFRRYHPHAEPQ